MPNARFRAYLSKCFVATYNVNSNINSLWSSFKLKCLELLNKWILSKNASTRFHQPWINTTLKRLCHRKQRYYNIACCSHLENDWLRFKNFKKYTQQEYKKAYNEYISGIVSNSNRANPKRLWSFIKSKRVDNCGVPALKLNDQIYYDIASYSKSNILNNYFHLVFTMDNLTDTPITDNNNLILISLKYMLP